ncbi:MAG: OmpA family protein [Bacteroidales bacterium]|nr:OmpA family protein [Bacteroidales bacterium]
MKYHFLLVIFFFIASLPVFAQSTGNAKADRLFEKAEQSYGRRDYTQAIRLIDEVLQEDANYLNAFLLKGDIYYDLKQPELAIVAYTKALSIDSTSFPGIYYILANLHFEQEKFDEAKRNYVLYLSFHPKGQTEIQKAEKNIILCDFRSELIKHPVPFNPVNLGPQVNSDGYEYINSVSLDEELMLFTRRGVAQSDHESFFRSSKEYGKWRLALEMEPPVNSPGNQGALCLSPDGMLLFMTCCSRRDSYGSCDLYVSRRRGMEWSEPLNLGDVVNSTAWDSQPCLSADGRKLYFVSTRRGGLGGSDIWMSQIDGSGEWGLPVNLGDTINTAANEMAPYIHQDGRTLYFSSAGHLGMGGADLFMSRLSAKGTWSKPLNLGYPVNTRNDEINLVINAGGDAAYISSAKSGGMGNTDIYRFELPAEVRPARISYVKGKVYDVNDKHPLAASLELIDMESGKIVVSSISDGLDGSFLMSLPVDKDYALNVSCKGYLFYSLNFSISDGRDIHNPLQLDIPMHPLVVGEKVILRNIFFDTDKFVLKSESTAELDKLLEFLKRNAAMKIEIGGHTDNVGTDAHNTELSQKRADAVYQYLISKGIEKDRLSAKGYGKSMPVDSNETPAGRANNRRTEFKVVSK